MGEVLADGSVGELCDFSATSLARKLAEILADESKQQAMGDAGPAVAAQYERSAQIERYAEGLKEWQGAAREAAVPHSDPGR